MLTLKIVIHVNPLFNQMPRLLSGYTLNSSLHQKSLLLVPKIFAPKILSPFTSIFH